MAHQQTQTSDRNDESHRACCVPHCTTRGYPVVNGRLIRYHLFPSDEELKRLWILNTCSDTEEALQVDNAAFICSLHFTPDDYIHTGYSRPMLKGDAVPSVFHCWGDTLYAKQVKVEQTASAVLSSVDTKPLYESQIYPVQIFQTRRGFVDETRPNSSVFEQFHSGVDVLQDLYEPASVMSEVADHDPCPRTQNKATRSGNCKRYLKNVQLPNEQSISNTRIYDTVECKVEARTDDYDTVECKVEARTDDYDTVECKVKAGYFQTDTTVEACSDEAVVDEFVLKTGEVQLVEEEQNVEYEDEHLVKVFKFPRVTLKPIVGFVAKLRRRPKDKEMEIGMTENKKVVVRVRHAGRRLASASNKFLRDLYYDCGRSIFTASLKGMDCRVKDIDNTINFIYTGKITLSLENVERMLRIGGHLYIAELINICERYLLSVKSYQTFHRIYDILRRNEKALKMSERLTDTRNELATFVSQPAATQVGEGVSDVNMDDHSRRSLDQTPQHEGTHTYRYGRTGGPVELYVLQTGYDTTTDVTHVDGDSAISSVTSSKDLYVQVLNHPNTDLKHVINLLTKMKLTGKEQRQIRHTKSNDIKSKYVNESMLDSSSQELRNKFHRMYKGLYAVKLNEVGCKAKELDAVVDFIYTGRITLSLDNIEKVLHIAGYFEISVLADVCEKYLTSIKHDETCHKIFLSLCRNEKAVMLNKGLLEIGRETKAYLNRYMTPQRLLECDTEDVFELVDNCCFRELNRRRECLKFACQLIKSRPDSSVLKIVQLLVSQLLGRKEEMDKSMKIQIQNNIVAVNAAVYEKFSIRRFIRKNQEEGLIRKKHTVVGSGRRVSARRRVHILGTELKDKLQRKIDKSVERTRTNRYKRRKVCEHDVKELSDDTQEENELERNERAISEADRDQSTDVGMCSQSRFEDGEKSSKTNDIRRADQKFGTDVVAETALIREDGTLLKIKVEPDDDYSVFTDHKQDSAIFSDICLENNACDNDTSSWCDVNGRKNDLSARSKTHQDEVSGTELSDDIKIEKVNEDGTVDHFML